VSLLLLNLPLTLLNPASAQTNPSRDNVNRVGVMQQSQMWNERRDEWRAQVGNCHCTAAPASMMREFHMFFPSIITGDSRC